MTYKAILQALEGGGIKFIDVTQNFKIFIRKKCNKICMSPNLESDLQMRIKIILEEGAVLIIIGHNTDLTFISTAQIYLMF